MPGPLLRPELWSWSSTSSSCTYYKNKGHQMAGTETHSAYVVAPYPLSSTSHFVPWYLICCKIIPNTIHTQLPIHTQPHNIPTWPRSDFHRLFDSGFAPSALSLRLNNTTHRGKWGKLTGGVKWLPSHLSLLELIREKYQNSAPRNFIQNQ